MKVPRRNLGVVAAATKAASAVSAASGCISTISWADPRVDVFGVAPNNSIWHKFYTGSDWQPNGAFEHFDSQVDLSTCPSVASWGEGNLDVFYVDDSSKAISHLYYRGSGSWSSEDIGAHGAGVSSLASVSWGEARLDIVGRADEGAYLHKAWTGDGWYPAEDKWEDLGRTFHSAPAVVSWGTGRLDIVGIDKDRSLWHKYYQDGWSEWESLGGGPFHGNPFATSWGPGRLDFWAVDSNQEMNHLYWDGSQWSSWEQLGGKFVDTPKVVHWNSSRIDIVGRNSDSLTLRLKSFDGKTWKPDGKDWYELAGPFESEPGLLAKKGTNFLYVFGIDDQDDLRMQIWSGYEWQPSFNETWSLGNLSSSEETALEADKGEKAQGLVGPLEL